MSVELRAQAMARGDRRSSLLFYRTVRGAIRAIVNPWLRVRAENTHVLDRPGPTILAPVHRSHLDSALVATQSSRRIRALGKQSLFTTPVVSYVCAALGAIPVRRGEADRDALAAAKMLLDRGESMIVFPEGSRRAGNEIGELFDGAAWLAARSGAPVVPIGITGTQAALPTGAKFLHRSDVAIVVGEPLPAPVGEDGKRASRQQLREFTAELTEQLQKAQDAAVALATASAAAGSGRRIVR
ncbi:MAG: 1-acyl-sn-glycerol-3-phosphate acyltransferase [Acidimicrobiia bacterium]|nr:1-acyl-sn-glycerol-3-phosphate acyltransferase [Acidimicrobiia bacterium]